MYSKAPGDFAVPASSDSKLKPRPIVWTLKIYHQRYRTFNGSATYFTEDLRHKNGSIYLWQATLGDW